MKTICTRITRNNWKKKSINELPDDCLREIFIHLPIHDKARLEAVCTKWKRILRTSWAPLKRLTLIPTTCECRRSGSPYISTNTNASLMITRLDHSALGSILSRCSRYLTQIDLMNCHSKLSEEDLTVVSKHCSNLRDVRAINLEAASANGLTRLLANSQSIRAISIVRCDDAILDCLRCLASDQLVDMTVLLSIGERNIRRFNEILAAAHSLKTLKLDYVNSLTLKIIGRMDLTGLTIIGTDALSAPEVNNMSLITNLQNLVQLNVANCDEVTDDFLVMVVKSLHKLQNLDVSHCSSLTEFGLMQIKHIPELRILGAEDLRTMTDVVLQQLSNLEELDVRNCDGFSDDGLIVFIQNSPDLQILEIELCSGVTRRTFHAAAMATRGRTNGKILRILSSLKEDFTEYTDMSSFLAISNINEKSELLIALHRLIRLKVSSNCA